MKLRKEMAYRDYVERESEFLRAAYDPELEFYYSIRAGEIKKVRKLCEERLSEKKGLGKLSDNPLQNMKYHFVITTAIVARYCIKGGLELSTAYSISDFYIQKADRCRTIKEIDDLHEPMCLDYARRMQSFRKSKICSKPVSDCVDYIYDHLHTRITLKLLAEHVNRTPSYISRLFKSETGLTVTDYIIRAKIETAGNMLVYSEYNISQIASILAFPSQSYFTEVFRKQTGITPKEYKREHFRDTEIDG